MIATLVKAAVVVTIAAVVATHAPSDLRPVKRAAAHARTVVTHHVHAAGEKVSRTWARVKRSKPAERIERILSLEESTAVPAPAVRGVHL